jgi:hypothetical protein
VTDKDDLAFRLALLGNTELDRYLESGRELRGGVLGAAVVLMADRSLAFCVEFRFCGSWIFEIPGDPEAPSRLLVEDVLVGVQNDQVRRLMQISKSRIWFPEIGQW